MKIRRRKKTGKKFSLWIVPGRHILIPGYKKNKYLWWVVDAKTYQLIIRFHADKDLNQILSNWIYETFSRLNAYDRPDGYLEKWRLLENSNSIIVIHGKYRRRKNIMEHLGIETYDGFLLRLREHQNKIGIDLDYNTFMLEQAKKEIEKRDFELRIESLKNEQKKSAALFERLLEMFGKKESDPSDIKKERDLIYSVGRR